MKDYFNLGFMARINGLPPVPPTDLEQWVSEEWLSGYRAAEQEYRESAEDSYNMGFIARINCNPPIPPNETVAEEWLAGYRAAEQEYDENR